MNFCTFETVHGICLKSGKPCDKKILYGLYNQRGRCYKTGCRKILQEEIRKSKKKIKYVIKNQVKKYTPTEKPKKKKTKSCKKSTRSVTKKSVKSRISLGRCRTKKS